MPVTWLRQIAQTETPLSAQVAEKAAAEGAGHVIVSAAIEAEIATLSDEEAAEFLADLGLEEPGLDRLIGPDMVCLTC